MKLRDTLEDAERASVITLITPTQHEMPQSLCLSLSLYDQFLYRPISILLKGHSFSFKILLYRILRLISFCWFKPAVSFGFSTRLLIFCCCCLAFCSTSSSFTRSFFIPIENWTSVRRLSKDEANLLLLGRPATNFSCFSFSAVCKEWSRFSFLNLPLSRPSI